MTTDSADFVVMLESDVQKVVQRVLSARLLAKLHCELCGWITYVYEPPQQGMVYATEWLEKHLTSRHAEIPIRTD